MEYTATARSSLHLPLHGQPRHPSVAVERTYKLWLWLDERLASFPTVARHGLGRHIEDHALELLEAYVVATYSPTGSDALRGALADANRHLAMLRLILRGCRERRYLSMNQYEHAAEHLAALGRITAAWIHRCGAEPPTPR